jgi:hypothetical protein
MQRISINRSQVDKLVTLLAESQVPLKLDEAAAHPFEWTRGMRELANAYFAIVAICHQTTPIGERGLQGYIDQTPQAHLKRGWDYLKERFLIGALKEPQWTSPSFWNELTPYELSALYQDDTLGKRYGDEAIGRTLNRLNERAFLINDLGRVLTRDGVKYIDEVFTHNNQTIGGSQGFLSFLEANFEAYKDPVRKKSSFFLSIVAAECDWKIKDPENLSSPVDYHELRGHLRIGTIMVNDSDLAHKVQRGLALTDQEDTELRLATQEVNDFLGNKAGLDSSRVHYLFWNVFRNCCPRESDKTHCLSCGSNCKLPQHYKDMPTYKERCVFSEICHSAGKPNKIIDPPYVGHYY